jgi:hypothetical protein
LPYSVRQAWNGWRVRRALRGLDHTAPMPAADPSGAKAEVHLLLCKRDVQLTVLALKSLLRFGVPLAVTLSEDGSVRPEERAWIDRHLPGCRWCPRIVDDPRMESALAGRPRLREVYHSRYHPICKLLHPALLARCPRVIVLDPDTAFFKRPDRLLAWVENEEPAACFLHDHQPEDKNVPRETREAFAELRVRLARPGRTWSMPLYFFNSGLLAYRPEQCDLDLAEGYIAWRAAAPERYTTGKPGLWFGTWTPEQTSYQLIFAWMDPPATPLGEEYRIGSPPGYTFNHFLWLQLVEPGSLVRLAELITHLPH